MELKAQSEALRKIDSQDLNLESFIVVGSQNTLYIFSGGSLLST